MSKNPGIINPRNCDSSVRQAIQQLATKIIGLESTPSFVDLTLTGLSASRLLSTDSSKVLTSVSNLASWIAGTGNQVIVANDGDGSITLSTPQDIHTSASPTFAALSLGTGELTAGSINRASGTLTLETVGITRMSLTSGSVAVPAGSQITIGTFGAIGLQLLGQDGDVSLVGTLQAQALVFRTGSVEKMRILANGDIGIGTNHTTPSTLLHLKDADAYLTLQNSTDENHDGGAETKLIFADHASNALAQIKGSHGGAADDSKGNLKFYVNNGAELATAMVINSAQDVNFAGDITSAKITTTTMTINNNGVVGQVTGPLLTFDDTNNFLEITGCKVGIATATPTETLTVSGSLTVSGQITIGVFGTSGLQIIGEPGIQGLVGTLDAFPLIFRTTAIARMQILSGGNVGIGATVPTPTAQLHVDQSAAGGAKPVLRLDQGDIDDSFIDFIGTSAADGSRSISSDTTEDSAKFGAIRVEINGVTKWIRIYDDES